MLDKDRLALDGFEKRFVGRLSHGVIQNRRRQPYRISKPRTATEKIRARMLEKIVNRPRWEINETR
jgi:hypothetical protein